MDDDAAAAARWCRSAGEAVADARAELLAAARVEWAGPASGAFGEAVGGLLALLTHHAGELAHAHDAAAAAARAARAATASVPSAVGLPGTAGAC